MNHNIKEKIRAKFDKAASTYDQNCTIQNEVCEQSIELLVRHQNHFKNIADFACGTGESTKRLIQQVSYSHCYAIDFASKLLSIAKKKLSQEHKVDFVHGDMDDLLLGASCLDLVFCNMGLQWSENLFSTIKLFHQYLIPGGILVFSMPVEGNFPEIKTTFKFYLPRHKTIIQTLIKEKFALLEYDIKKITVRFSKQFELLKSLKSIGANYNKLDYQYKQGLSKIKIRDFFSNPENTCLTYKIGIYLARKNKP